MKQGISGPVVGLEETSDEELMLAYQKGSEEAFASLYERHSGKVYGYLSKRLPERSSVDDAFQAAFLKLHTARATYDPSLPFLPWLFAVTHSAMIENIRKRKRVRMNEIQDEGALQRAPAPVLAETAAVPGLENLPLQQRQALELRYGEGLSFEEIAQKLGLTPGNSRQLTSRAVRRLRKIFRGIQE